MHEYKPIPMVFNNKNIHHFSIFFAISLLFLLGCNGLKSENEKLKEEVIDVNAENDKLKKELNALKTENSNTHVRLAQLNIQISSLEIEIQNLQKGLDSLKSQIKGDDKKNKRS